MNPEHVQGSPGRVSHGISTGFGEDLSLTFCFKGRAAHSTPRNQNSLSLAWTHHHPQTATTCGHFSMYVARDKAAQPEGAALAL